MKRFSIVSLCVFAALSLFAERQEFSRYQPIIDRQMFGPLPAGFDPTKPPSEVQKSSGKAQKELTKEQEQIKKSVKFSMINLNPKGETMVGFTDNTDAKNVRHYYLKVGETRDGWTVKAADAVAATVSISKDGVDLDLELGGGSGGDKNATATATTTPGRRGSVSPIHGNSGGGFGSRGLLGGGAGSLRDRRQAKLLQREAMEKTAAEERAKREEEEKAKAEEDKAEREAEREQQRQQLQQIQEELKRAREARQAQESEKEKDSDASESPSDE